METKGELIGEIEAIYRDMGHERRGKPLEQFSLAQLRRHLDSLTNGLDWVKRSKKQIPPSPPLSKGGIAEQI